MVSELLDSVSNFRKVLSKKTSININSQELKADAVDIAKDYFSRMRSYIEENGLGGELLSELDKEFQDLLRLTQGNYRRTLYLKLLKNIETNAKNLSIIDVVRPKAKNQFADSDDLLLQTLDSILPTAALSYKQALYDLNICDHKVSFRGTASELREALRETLDHLAPDKDVMKENGFKLEVNQTKPTMKQKVRYILKKRNLNDTKRLPSEKSVEMVDEIVGQMARAIYNRASLSTHLQTSKAEVLQIKRYIDIVFHEVLELEQNYR